MPIPTENERNGGRMSVRRKFANLLEYCNPFSMMPPQQHEDEDAPAAKKPRLETSTSSSKAVDNAADDTDSVVDERTYRYVAEDTLTASPDNDTVAVAIAIAPTATVNVVASSATRAGTSRARSLRRRWTREEDAKLMDAVTKFGYNWIRIATLIPGRTNINCRQRWTKNLNPTKEHPTGKWTAVDDARLIVAVQELGNAWFLVAERVPGRTDTQCRSRWVTCLVFAIFYRGKWSLEEDSKLTEAVKELGNEGSGSNGCTVSF
jgi:hypothetical protein